MSAVERAALLPSKTGSRWPGPPGPPEAVSIQAEAITLRWEAPKSSGGKAIIGYRVETRKGGAGDFVLMLAHTHNAEPRVELQGLEPTTWYEFRVCAINELGEGAVGKECEPILTRKLRWQADETTSTAAVRARRRRTEQTGGPIMAAERKALSHCQQGETQLAAEIRAARGTAAMWEETFQLRHGRLATEEDRQKSTVLRDEAHALRVLKHAHAEATAATLDAERT